MAEPFAVYRERGINRVAFGDLFLEDIRAYRERLLAENAMLGLYPIWKRDTRAVINEFSDQGFKTAVVCVDPKQLARGFSVELSIRTFSRSSRSRSILAVRTEGFIPLFLMGRSFAIR